MLPGYIPFANGSRESLYPSLHLRRHLRRRHHSFGHHDMCQPVALSLAWRHLHARQFCADEHCCDGLSVPHREGHAQPHPRSHPATRCVRRRHRQPGHRISIASPWRDTLFATCLHQRVTEDIPPRRDVVHAIRHLLSVVRPFHGLPRQFNDYLRRRHPLPTHQDRALGTGRPTHRAGLPQRQFLPNHPLPDPSQLQHLLGRGSPQRIFPGKPRISQPAHRQPQLRQFTQPHRRALELYLVQQHQPRVSVCGRAEQFYLRICQRPSTIQSFMGQQRRQPGFLPTRGGFEQCGLDAEHLPSQREFCQPGGMSPERRLVHPGAGPPAGGQRLSGGVGVVIRPPTAAERRTARHQQEHCRHRGQPAR